MIGLTDLLLAARSRRRHRLTDDGSLERPACLRLACESVETIAHRLWSETDGAFRDKSAEDRRLIAGRLRFQAWRRVTNRLSEGTP